MDAQLQLLCEHLPAANARKEAGFFFEEGGCWGFALALHEVLSSQGRQAQIVLQKGWAHAFVRVEGVLVDYTGVSSASEQLFEVEPAELRAYAIEHAGHLDEEITEAMMFAKSVIALAQDLPALTDIQEHPEPFF